MDKKKKPNKTFLIGGELKVNRMGYGAMRITGEGIWGPPQDKAEAIRVLKKSVELGVNFIDTADSYGPNISEELIAEALHPYDDNLVIATKAGFERTGPNKWHVNAKRDHLQKALEGSLRRLKLEQIPLYQLHRIDESVPWEEMFGFLRDAQRDGLIRHIGLSEVGTEEIKKARDFVNVVSVQNKYSLDYRKWEETLNYCEEENIAFIPWNPINAGNLQDEAFIQSLAKKYSASKNQIALSWLLHRADNILLIPGTSKKAHLEENVAAANIDLTLEEVEKLNHLNLQSA